ncbi:glycosyltransferase family 2 protein [Parafilimonas sp.]|uniref:glycosyltransferase family 2 protein n=1 Tax=Parafilimonas sp. TaxID=1969739 RepID=UPI0039E24C45
MKVSVCIPTFNQAHCLQNCINSVLAQSLLPCEIIISNDASTDNTATVLTMLKRKTTLLKVIHQPGNTGITANVNACFKQAMGDYIVRLDSDDLLLPGYIRYLSGLLNRHPMAGYAHCAVQEINEHEQVLRIRSLFRQDAFETGETALKRCLKGYRVSANIIMFRKKALQETGFLQCPSNFAEDYYLAADIAAHGYGNVYTPAVYACYRVWNNAGRQRMKRKLEEIKGITNVFEEVLEPAFKKRNYAVREVHKAREYFAVAHANCLSNSMYNENEKMELKAALLRLSSSVFVRFMIMMYEKKLYYPLAGFIHLKNNGRLLIKNILQKLQPH